MYNYAQGPQVFENIGMIRDYIPNIITYQNLEFMDVARNEGCNAAEALECLWALEKNIGPDGAKRASMKHLARYYTHQTFINIQLLHAYNPALITDEHLGAMYRTQDSVW